MAQWSLGMIDSVDRGDGMQTTEVAGQKLLPGGHALLPVTLQKGGQTQSTVACIMLSKQRWYGGTHGTANTA